MTNDIINSILEGYKEKHRQGKTSLHEFLKDPLFLALPLEKQVEAVQSHANVLAGAKAPTQGKLLARSVVAGASAGLFSSFPLTPLGKTPLTKGLIMASGAMIGGIVGGVSGKLLYSGDKERHETTNKYLIRLSQSHAGPDVPNAVKVLDINRRYEPRTITSIVGKMVSPEKSIIDRVVPMSIKNNQPKLTDIDNTLLGIQEWT